MAEADGGSGLESARERIVRDGHADGSEAISEGKGTGGGSEDWSSHVERSMERGRNVVVASVFPRILVWFALISSSCHDILLVAAAYFAYLYTPPSVHASLGNLDIVWTGMFFAGGIAGIVGAFARKPSVEITGCVLMASGKFTWAITAMTQHFITPSTVALASVLAAGAFTTLWRMWVVVVSLYIRVRD